MQELASRLAALRRQVVLGCEVAVATSFCARLLGLSRLGREQAGSGLLIPRCSSVHTFGMRFALDLVFLDAEGVPVAIHRDVGPRRFVGCRAAASVLEIPSPQGGEFSPLETYRVDVAQPR